jgi:IS605 OrfB family transposase
VPGRSRARRKRSADCTPLSPTSGPSFNTGHHGDWLDSADTLVIEDLALNAMSRSLHRAFRRSVADVGLGELRRQLLHKAQRAGRTVVVVDRWFPSSKTCSACGLVHAGLQLSDRHWTFAACGARHDRDLNAAINIEREGLRLLAETHTPRSGRTDSRGEAVSTAIGQPVVGPTSTNRELSYRAALRRSRADVWVGQRANAREG